MRYLVVCAILLLKVVNTEKIAFAYEMIRHGARAPGSQDTNGYFQVQPGMLTASGMR